MKISFLIHPSSFSEEHPMTEEANKVYEYHQGNFTVSTRRELLDIEVIHTFLSKEAYWSRGIPKDLLLRSLRNSLCFGLYEQEQQIGFARVITDYATYAAIYDVFVLKPYRGRGLGQWLMECLVTCPALQGLRSLSLGTSDAHEFYKKIGFAGVSDCSNQMQILYNRPWFIVEESV
jgi:N-acetylglutamate synthase-like GNAT family acetyltransferase